MGDHISTAAVQHPVPSIKVEDDGSETGDFTEEGQIDLQLLQDTLNSSRSHSLQDAIQESPPDVGVAQRPGEQGLPNIFPNDENAGNNEQGLPIYGACYVPRCILGAQRNNIQKHRQEVMENITKLIDSQVFRMEDDSRRIEQKIHDFVRQVNMRGTRVLEEVLDLNRKSMTAFESDRDRVLEMRSEGLNLHEELRLAKDETAKWEVHAQLLSQEIDRWKDWGHQMRSLFDLKENEAVELKQQLEESKKETKHWELIAKQHQDNLDYAAGDNKHYRRQIRQFKLEAENRNNQITQLERKQVRSREENAKLEQRVQELEGKLGEEKKQATQLSDQLHASTTERLNTEKLLKASQSRLGEMKANLDQALQKVARGQSLKNTTQLANPNKTSDATIQSSWIQLQYNVRNVAYLIGSQAPVEDLPDQARQRFRVISVNFATRLRDDDDRILLLQGYLWRKVFQEVFSGHGALRTANAKDFKNIRQRVLRNLPKHPDELKKTHDWLLEAWSAIKQEDPTSGEIQKLVTSEARLLAPFLKAGSGYCDKVLRSVEDDLRTIFVSALRLDDILLSSKADFRVLWRGAEPMTYDESVMEATVYPKTLTSETRVDFTISPRILKRGNADGHNYESEMVLVKSQVVCF